MRIKKENMFPVFYSKMGRTLTKKERKKEWVAVLVLIIGFMFVAIATYTLPDDVLTRNPTIGNIINILSNYVPSIGRFGRMSEFPEVAQAIYAAELMCVPFLIIWMLKSFGFEVASMPAARWRVLLALPFFAVMIWSALVYFPGSSDGTAPSSRISRTLLESRLGFAFWSVVMTVALAGFMSLLYAWTKAVPKIFNKYSD